MTLPLASLNSRRRLAVVTVALFVTTLFAALSPGLEFFNAYTWLVFTPQKLVGYLGIPWTYNPGWLVALMAPFVILPGRVGLVLFVVATVVMIVAGASILRGKPIPVLLSAQMAWILWWAQIDAFVVLGVAFGWLALEKKNGWLMGLALALATLKPQMGLIAIAALWWWGNRKMRWISLSAYTALVVISVIVWGPWPIWFLQGIVIVSRGTQYGSWNSSLGLVALPLFVPAILLPLDHRHRLTALTATSLLCSPYMPYYSTIILLCMDIPWWAYLFAFLGYLPGVVGTTIAWNGIALLPIGVLGWLYLPYIRARWQAWSQARQSTP